MEPYALKVAFEQSYFQALPAVFNVAQNLATQLDIGVCDVFLRLARL